MKLRTYVWHLVKMEERILKISIIVPIYNGEKYLERCVESIKNQTHKNIEVILIDDGSNDDSPKICKKYEKNDFRIKYIRQENSGVSVARNRGIKEASGEWLIFVDADDMIAPNMCSLINNNTDDSTDLILFDFKEFSEGYVVDLEDETDELDVYFYSNDDKAALQRKAFGYTKDLSEMKTSLRTPWAKAYRKKFLTMYDINYDIGIRMGQDFLFNLRTLENITKIKYIRINVYYYYNNLDSTTRRYKPDMEEIDRGFYSALDMQMQHSSNREDLEFSYYASVLDGLLLYLRYYYFHPENNDSISIIKKDIHRLIASNPYQQAIDNSNNRFFKEFFPLSKRVIIFLLKRENLVVLSGIHKFRNIANLLK